MISAVMALTGLLLLSADSIPVVTIGIGLIVGFAYREGAFYGMKEKTKRKESCHRPKYFNPRFREGNDL